MARILLTHGYFLEDDEKERQIMKPYPPLGLLYLSAYLKLRGHEVEVYDSTFGSHAELSSRLAAARGAFVGIYTNLLTRGAVLRIIAEARRAGATVVLGGPESANHPLEYLRRGADAIVIGEGEETLHELITVLDASGSESRGAVRGIAYLDAAGALVRTPPRAAIADLDSLPLPDREAIDHDLYLAAWRRHHGASSINLITARGCPYRCTWCSHAVYGYSHRRRSPAQVADEAAWIVRRYDPDQLWYADDVFTISHPWLRQYAAELQQRGIHKPFETITRADRLQSPAAVDALRALGCYRIWIGSESGSQKVLDAMERGVSVAQVRRAIELSKSRGIAVGMFLMWGYEGEELEDIAATIEHVKVSDPDVYLTTVAYPIKGTPYFDRVQDKVHAPDDWSQCTDRDYSIAGRRDRQYYRLADVWLRSEVEAHRLRRLDPQRAAELQAAAARARGAMAAAT